MKHFILTSTVLAMFAMGAMPAVAADMAPPTPIEKPDPKAISPEAAMARGFDTWMRGEAVSRAQRHGVPSSVIAEIFPKVSFQSHILPKSDKGAQSEFKETFDEYLGKRVSEWRLRKGREMMQEHAKVLAEIEYRYGVPAHVIVALWGMETSYGHYAGKIPVVDALATLAYTAPQINPRRSDEFMTYFLDALKVLGRDYVSYDRFVGSWAGASGQVQFMPTNILTSAVDGDGDGKKDIWGNPYDIFASAAQLLLNKGWAKGERWGRYVALPSGFDKGAITTTVRKPKWRTLREWKRMGITQENGQPLPDADIKAFVVYADRDEYPNTRVILGYQNFITFFRWNRAYKFVVASGLISDHLRAHRGAVDAELARLKQR